MQTVTLKIDDSFYAHFMALVDSLPKKQVKVVDRPIPAGIVATTIDDVEKRIEEAEKSKDLDSTTYKKEMSDFFKKELGISL